MQRTRLMFLIFLATFTTASALWGRPVSAVLSPCQTESGLGAVAARMVKQALTANDSAGIVANGLPYKPTQVSIVSDSTTCQPVIDSYNGQLAPADSGLTVSSGYVISVDSGAAYGLVIFGSDSGPHHNDEIAIFDSTFAYKFSQETLR